MTLVVRDLHTCDVGPMVALRASDAAECALLGMTPREAIIASIEASDECWVMEDDGEPLVYGGLRRMMLAGTVHVWMLGTEAALDYSVAVARMGRRAVRAALREANAITVTVARDNIEGIRWAEWLGFRPAASFHPFIEYRKDNF